ncbi:MAG: hypothetical protein RIE86_05720 [Imperialibacter sp.]|uniref:hypothetical protein n=1 Tax=Imperialibacter sp. TaxID=2038411 RepID=UPI0032EABBFD
MAEQPIQLVKPSAQESLVPAEPDSFIHYQAIIPLLQQMDSIHEELTTYKGGDSTFLSQSYFLPSYTVFSDSTDYSRTNYEFRFQIEKKNFYWMPRLLKIDGETKSIKLKKWNDPAGYISVPDSATLVGFSFDSVGFARVTLPIGYERGKVVIIDRAGDKYQYAILHEILNEQETSLENISQARLMEELYRAFKK